MSSYPDLETHSWADLVVGGSAGNPLLLKLWENPLVENGSFEDSLDIWNPSGVRTDFGKYAQHGNYVMGMVSANYIHYHFSRTSPNTGNSMNLVLFTGFLKMTPAIVNGTLKIRVYADNSTTHIASPTHKVDLTILTDDACIVADNDGKSQWVTFYVMADLTGHSGTNVHFEIICNDYTHISYYLDDFKSYEVIEALEMECPNRLQLVWGRKTDAEYEMMDGSKKDYLRGWRAAYQLQYDYCSRAEFIRHIGISESEFNFFAPQCDNLNGEYVRLVGDLDAAYFADKFLGHSRMISLEGIYLRKYKNREYDDSYFTIAST
jgi:hypothetical protein